MDNQKITNIVNTNPSTEQVLSLNKAPLENNEYTKVKIDKFIPATKKVDTYQKIPRKIFQTWKTADLPDEMFQIIKNNLKLNPEYDYYLFDDDDCRNFIAENFPDQVLNAFDKLIPGALKADLWRYCVLYIHGGIYYDTKQTHKVPLSEIINNDDDMILCKDQDKVGIYNAFMASIPRNMIFIKIIDKCVSNIMSEYYGNNPLDITGPHVVGDIFTQLISKPLRSEIELGTYKISDLNLNINIPIEKTFNIMYPYKNITFGLSYYPEYYSKHNIKSQYHMRLWYAHNVYK